MRSGYLDPIDNFLVTPPKILILERYFDFELEFGC
jgi:hypothetical protein